MAVKPRIANKLWGRAGARCAVCRIQLSPVGTDATIGEIAHIVSRKQQGPRGDADLAPELRDEYDNLIILCRNDHKIVDTDLEEWTAEKLRLLKLEHEQWIAGQLEQGRAQPYAIDNTGFIIGRQEYWAAQGRRTWLFTALTPLLEEPEVIEPVTENFVSTLSNIALPNYFPGEGYLNPPSVNTEPSQNGLVNELFPSGMQYGYRVEIFRTGHIEFTTSIDALMTETLLEDTNRARRHMGIGRNRLKGQTKTTWYEWIANSVEKQTEGVHQIWKESAISRNDMILSVALLNVDGLCLYGSGTSYNVPGRPIEGDRLTISFVVDGAAPVKEHIEILLTRLVNCMGLMLPEVYDEDGGFIQPQKLC